MAPKTGKMCQIHHVLLQFETSADSGFTAQTSPAQVLYFLFVSAAAVSNSGLHNFAAAMQAPVSTPRSAVPGRQPRPFQAAPRHSAGTSCAPTCVNFCLSLLRSALHDNAAHVQSRSGLTCVLKQCCSYRTRLPRSQSNEAQPDPDEKLNKVFTDLKVMTESSQLPACQRYSIKLLAGPD